jgi:redox-sensitive bicupin YhaK (pirin superfamily)
VWLPGLSRRRFLLGAASTAGASWLVGCRAEEAPPPAAAITPEARGVALIVPARPGRDGAGVKLAKSLGSKALPMLDPFLMLDEIKSDRPEDVIRGFPDHPHRGFETVTYVIEGAVEHRDSVGNEGLLGPGSAQWMTAGRGIVHSEMPRPEANRLWGLQLWINLPRAQKMVAPRYQDVPREVIPEVASAGGPVRVVTGTVGGQSGPVSGIVTAPTMLDVTVGAGTAFQHELLPTHAAFAYVLDGVASFGGDGQPVPRGTLAVLGPGATALVRSDAGARVLLLAAAPIGEPVARRGPFVMNTESELDQAFADHRAGRLGT